MCMTSDYDRATYLRRTVYTVHTMCRIIFLSPKSSFEITQPFNPKKRSRSFSDHFFFCQNLAVLSCGGIMSSSPPSFSPEEELEDYSRSFLNWISFALTTFISNPLISFSLSEELRFVDDTLSHSVVSSSC